MVLLELGFPSRLAVHTIAVIGLRIVPWPALNALGPSLALRLFSRPEVVARPRRILGQSFEAVLRLQTRSQRARLGMDTSDGAPPAGR